MLMKDKTISTNFMNNSMYSVLMTAFFFTKICYKQLRKMKNFRENINKVNPINEFFK